MKKCISFILILCFSLGLIAQEEDEYVLGDNSSSTATAPQKSGFDWGNVTIGGGLGLTFGTITYVEVAPTVGYFLTDNILTGVGINYVYYENNQYNYSTSIYGGRVFGQYLFEDLPFLGHVETEIINIDLLGNKERVNIVNLYVGGGLKQHMGQSSYFYLLALWNLNETKESFYIQRNPVIRLGISIGL